MSTAEAALKAEPGRYFLVGPEKQVILVNRALFEAVSRFTKPNRRFGRMEVVFKNGAICDITCTEHLMNVATPNLEKGSD
jgi:hypothetical protein